MPKNFKMADWPKPKTFRRAGQDAFFDPCRKQLVPADPEEDVRQRFVSYLVDELRVPLKMIETEFNLTWFKKGARGRVDVVVLGETDDGCFPLFLAECKASSVAIVDEHVEQALRYDDVLEVVSEVIAVTNGLDTEWYQLGDDGWVRVQQVPDYQGMLASVDLKPMGASKPPARIQPDSIVDEDVEFYRGCGILGVESPVENTDYIINLGGLIYFADTPDFSGDFGSYKHIEAGERYTRFGNAGGGSWPGHYRYFVVEDEGGDAQVVSISLMGQMSVRNDPHWGNVRGTTRLLLAVDSFDKSHISLSLNMDKYVRRVGKNIEIWHDCKLTRGNRGAAKMADVLAFVREHEPELVVGDEVVLGQLPNDRVVEWADARDFVERCIRYALVRDAFREAF